MKKIIFSLAFFGVLTTGAFAGTFSDVSEDNKNYDAIIYLSDHKVIDGYADGTFKPNTLVNRAEAMKIVTGAFNVKHDGEYEATFPDVKKEDWFFTYVMGAREALIVSGYSDKTFKPANNVNLAETLKMIVLSAKVELPKDVVDNIFADVSSSVWYAPHALFARDHNLVMPDEYGKLNADSSMTRAAFAEIIYRMMVVLENNNEPFPLDRNWATYEGTYLPFKMKYDSESWQLIENPNEVVFFRPDKVLKQFSPDRIYPNSGVVTVALDKNLDGLTKTKYFDNLKFSFPDATYTEFRLKDLSAFEVLYPEKRTVDWYVYLPNGYVLAVFTEFGDGVLGYQLKQYIKAMLSTLEYNEIDLTPVDYSSLLSEIFENVLVENVGMDMLNKLPEKLIIETDTIGVGTGPVDYYYSEGVDYTFKYERSSDVILDTRQGKTTSF